MTTIEHKEVKGLTVKNIIVTVISTISIVVSVMTTYFQLKADVSDVRNHQETTERVNEIRMKILEGQVALLQHEIEEVKAGQSK
jgi:sensor domain CHASE-containing protein